MCKKDSNKVLEWFKRGLKNDETGDHLNYYTMEIKTPQIKQDLQTKYLQNFDSFFWFAFIL